jgi:hypothetical protein
MSFSLVVCSKGFIMKASRLIMGLLSLTVFSAYAGTQDVAVTAAGDSVYYREWWRGGADRGWIVDANPNQVSHTYYDGSGSERATALSFDLSAMRGTALADIASVTFNFDVLAVWTEGRNDIGNLSNVDGSGTVYADGGTGRKSFDVTTYVKSVLAQPTGAASFYFDKTGYSGFTFGSAEGGQPAFLRFQTTSITQAVPEPEAYAMALAGLGVMGLLAVRRKPQSA